MRRGIGVGQANTNLAAARATSADNGRALPSFLAPKPPPRSGNDNVRFIVRPGSDGPADELECLRSVLPRELLQAAERRARALGIGADQVLIKSGMIEEAVYLQWLSFHTGIACETFAEIDRDNVRIPDGSFPFGIQTGLLSIHHRDELTYIVAPQRFAARLLCRFAMMHPNLTYRLRLASAAGLQRFIIDRSGSVLAQDAAYGLARTRPALSAAPASLRTSRSWRSLERIALGGALLVLMALLAMVAGAASSGVLAILFIAFAGLRLAGTLAPRQRLPTPYRRPDDQLPAYTIVAALYREAESVAPLMRAIDALDYPLEKLDVILVVEPDDAQTQAAIRQLGPMPHVRTLIAPAVGPQTKPKALNCALPFARGSLLAVFDAEDRPEPDQLRAALETFDAHDDSLACVQASLCIDNGSDSWLARMFAAEYAGQFDVFLPGLETLGMPLPLGGSSNHFRTDILRKVGGWDAHNVTEDADLGFRLARFGYRSGTFASTTYEEAPIRFGAWLRQRSRWMKGWMQTWLVHMRNPRRLWQDAGPRGFLALNLIVGTNVLTALACPILLWTLITFPENGEFGGMAPLHGAAIAAGVFSTVLTGLLGLARRRQLRRGWVLALTPVYWMYLSIAAWRALLQLFYDPYRWEKTEHGLSLRRSASDAATSAARKNTPQR